MSASTNLLEVLVFLAAYDELTERKLFLEAVEEGTADLKAGRVFDHADVVAEVKKRFGRRGRR